MDKETAIIMTQSKSQGIAILLTLMFGAFGLFYVGTKTAIWTIIVEAVLILLTIVTLGIGGIFLGLFHIYTIILAVNGVKKHNEELIAGLEQPAS